jgi:hypothetical protein
LAAGIHVGRKRFARLMKTTGLSGVSRRRWVTTTVRDTNAHPASDLVERNFSAHQDRIVMGGRHQLHQLHPDLDRLSLSTIEGYEAMHMIRKGQARWVSGDDVCQQNQCSDQVFDLAA